MTFMMTYHANHDRSDVECRPDMRVDGQEQEPTGNTSPDR